MRILASNPDTIGDLVLRQPLYAALQAAGHELALIVRSSAAEVPALIAPGAAMLLLTREVYADAAAQYDAADGSDLADLLDSAAAFAPDLLLIAPYQWTAFDERLAAALRQKRPNLVVAGMTGHLYPGDPHNGHAKPSSLVMDQVAVVDEDQPEAHKNAALAEMLGCPVARVDPLLPPIDAERLDVARQRLADRGLAPGAFWVACVTGTAHVPIKAWQTEKWAAALAEWARRHGRKFLFVGLPDEQAEVDRVRAMMNDAADATAIWMEPGGSIQDLAALLSLAGGYVGHDTGPMHLAAALGKPVLAVFGGGHKLRFAPCVTPSVVLTVRVPCAGCGWACSFQTSHCVKELSVDAMLSAIDDMEAGRIADRQHRLMELPDGVQAGMIRFAADLARQRQRDTGDARNQLEAERQEQKALAADLRAQWGVSIKRADAIEIARQALEDEAAKLVRQVQEREQAVIQADARTAAEAEARRLEVEDVRRHAVLAQAGADAVRGDLGVARQTIADLQTKIAAQEARLAAAGESRAALEAKARKLEAEAASLEAKRASAEARLAQAVSASASLHVAPAIPAPPRRTWRERIVDLICGQRHFTPPAVTPMPSLCVVARVRSTDSDDAARRTIQSVLAEPYGQIERVLIADELERSIVRESADRFDRMAPQGESAFAGVAEAFAATSADLVCWLDAGMILEPGALMRAGEYFRDHSLAMAATFGQTIQNAAGWRAPMVLPRLDVRQLLKSGPMPRFVVFRRQAYGLLGPIRPAWGQAAGWELTIRFARRFGIRRVASHAVCLNELAERSAASASDWESAAAAFRASFGLPGRARCAVLAAMHASVAGVARPFGKADRRFWPLPIEQAPADAFAPASTDASSAPVGPVTHRHPDQLLLTTPDVAAGDQRLHRAYYDATGDAAVAFPPVDGHTLGRLYDQRQALARTAGVDPGDRPSPFRGFVGGPRWVQAVARWPSPYWRLAGRKAGDESPAARVASLVGKSLSADPAVRALVVGSYDGAMLDELAQRTRWQLAGLETNAAAADASRAKGHTVWSASPQSAFMALPDGLIFDLIVVPGMLEHWPDPVWMLRRLTRLLMPGGRLILRTPNLDSRLLTLYGPTWWHWQLPHHRVLFGRKGLSRLAAACDLRVVKLRTITDAYTAAASARLNAVGLAGVVPEGAAFDDETSAAGARLAGWGRMLWDWRGQGDEMWAMLRPV